MASEKATISLAGKRAEYYVFNELLKGGVMPYLPAVSSGADTLLKTAKGTVLELLIILPGDGGSKALNVFTLPEYKPDKKRFIVCVEFDESDAPVAWVLPSLVFHAYSTGPNKKGLRTLNLDGGRQKYFGEPLRDYIRGFRNRWELITNYQYYRRFMGSPEGYENLEDILLMLLVAESPATEEELVPFKSFTAPIQVRYRNRRIERLLLHLDPDNTRRIIAAINALAANPRPVGSIRL